MDVDKRNMAGYPGEPSPAGVVSAAALLLVEYSDRAWVRLLEEHVADLTGHCHACSSTAFGPPVWPCSLWSIARHAQLLAEQRGSPARRRGRQ
jgi:hypothetical protein